MVSIDKAAIVLTMAIVAIVLGFTATGGITQDVGPAITTPPTVSTETSESEASSFGADLAAEIREKAGSMEEEVMMEEIEEEVMMEEIEEEVMMEESTEPQTHTVEIPVGTGGLGCETTNECYSPADITINAGDTVEWINIDSVAHTVTAGSPRDAQVEVFDSSLMMADKSWSFTFEDAGSYDYFCMIHAWMTGSVTVN